MAPASHPCSYNLPHSFYPPPTSLLYSYVPVMSSYVPSTSEERRWNGMKKKPRRHGGEKGEGRKKGRSYVIFSCFFFNFDTKDEGYTYLKFEHFSVIKVSHVIRFV